MADLLGESDESGSLQLGYHAVGILAASRWLGGGGASGGGSARAMRGSAVTVFGPAPRERAPREPDEPRRPGDKRTPL
jgi:hypothetical protein